MLSHSRRVLIGAVVIFCTSLIAGQPTPIPQPRPNPNPNPNAGDGRAARGAPIFNNSTPGAGGESMIEELIRQMQVTSPKQDEQGNVALVARAKAALCPICNQPLHKHADPNWEGCVPMDDDGNARRMQRILSVQAIDPISNTQFTAALPGNLNDRGGRDRDNCIHSIGKTVVHSTIWISPETGYAAVIPSDKRGESFQLGLDGKPLSPEIKSFVREKLTPVMEERMKRILGLREENPIPQNLRPLSNFVLQPQIPDWIKYDHALQIYEQQKPPHAFLARLYYEAAHACRREVNSEVAAPALDPALQESLSRGIQRVNYYMMSENNNVRRERGSPIIDPRKAETDPQIISIAAERILTAGKRLGVRPQDRSSNQIEAPAPRQNYFTTADMFLAHIIFAGAQNRMGNSLAAQKSLEEALVYVPEQLAVQVDNPEFEKRIRQQLKMLRSIVFDRLNCLKKEQEWLFKSAKHNMAAVKFNEFKFRNYQDGFKPGEPNRAWDPAQFAYLTGELMRRAGGVQEDSETLAGARAWFDAAERLVDKNLEMVDAAEKANPIAVPVALPNVMAPENPYERERALMVTLKMWSREQRKLMKKTKAPIPEISAIVLQVMQAAGLNDKAINAKIPDAPDNPDPVAQPNSASGEAGKGAVNAGSGERPKTRDEMFKMYYAAIVKFRAEKMKNPARLQELVDTGYLSTAQSCLNEKGELFCPQSNEKLLYMRNSQPGEPLIFRVGVRSLYSDGSIRDHK